MSAIPLWQLRARFAAALSSMYGIEVPAYTTLVKVSAQVNADYVDAHPEAERFGTLHRVTAERHGAIRLGGPDELSQVAALFAAFGMYPVGFYDLRDADSPVPVVSTAFRPVDRDELDRNPFRVFTSMLATADPRFFRPQLRRRVERFVAQRQLFDPALIATARRIEAHGGCPAEQAGEFVRNAVQAFALSTEPIDRGWYDELSRVSAVAADIAGVASGISDGTLRVRFGEVEARGVALTRKGRQHYDAAMAAPASWAQHFPATDAEMAAKGLAYYRGGDPTRPVVYEDFLPASAAGIFRSNLEGQARKTPGDETGGYDRDWMSGAINRDLFDPYALYEKAAS